MVIVVVDPTIRFVLFRAVTKVRFFRVEGVFGVSKEVI